MGFKNKSPKGHRVFFALPVDAELAHALEQWRAPWLLCGRWIPSKNFHLTLSFLGAVDDTALDALMDVSFEGLRPFSLNFGQLGYFAKAQILFVEPLACPNELTLLAKTCQRWQQRWGSAKKENRYVPHISLAREVTEPVPVAETAVNLSTRMNRVQLLESTPTKTDVHYQVLQEWPLRPPLRPQPR